MMSYKRALLALEDESVYQGESFGAQGTVVAEACFNTSMTGYQEILTDPSYGGQMIVMTCPQIGNYGVNNEDEESDRPQALGFIVRELSPIVSNYRASGTLEDYLEKHGVVGIQSVDTRAIAMKLRESGVMKALLTTEDMSLSEAVERARGWQGLDGVDYVCKATCAAPYEWTETSPPASAPHVVAYDFGVKRNILRLLAKSGFRVTVVPASTSAEEVLGMNPDGIFLSNGPGDPAAVNYAHKNVAALIGKRPIFGICMGHQILAHAFGGATFKLKFGHRGANQPVKDLRTGRIEITSQNHGYAVDPASLDIGEVEVTHVNLNDRTCSGIRSLRPGAPAFSVQYHPEASPGPHDAEHFFKDFAKEAEKFRVARR